MSSSLLSTFKTISTLFWVLGMVLLSVVISYSEFMAHMEKIKRKEFLKRKAIRKCVFSGLLFIFVGVSVSAFFGTFTPIPDITKIKDVLNFPPEILEGGTKSRHNFIAIETNGPIQSRREIQFDEAKYEIRITSAVSEALGETARIKVYLGEDLIADYFTSIEFGEKIIEFYSPEKNKRRLVIEFVNDYLDRERDLDRNAFIRSVTIRKMFEIPKSKEIYLLLYLRNLPFFIVQK